MARPSARGALLFSVPIVRTFPLTVDHAPLFMIAAMKNKPLTLALLIGAALTIMATSCSCNAIKECFGGKEETSATCGKCGGTSCTAACGAGHAEASAGGKLVHSCTRSAEAQNERAADVKKRIFSKAVATNELPDGYAFVFREPAAFASELEEVAAFERKCCATFTWAVVTGEGTQELRVTGGDAKAEIGAGLRKLGWMQ